VLEAPTALFCFLSLVRACTHGPALRDSARMEICWGSIGLCTRSMMDPARAQGQVTTNPSSPRACF